MLVHQLGDPFQVVSLECRAGLAGQLLEPVQRVLDLPCSEDLGGGALLAGEEEQEALAQRGAHPVGQPKLARLDPAVRLEAVGPHPAEGARVLILLADRAADQVDLEVAGGLGQPGRVEVAPGETGERLDRAHRVRPGGAEAGTGRGFADGGQLDRAALPMVGERLAQDRMAHLARVVDLLSLEVVEDVAATGARRDGHVHVPVDRGGHDEAPVLAVVGGEIGAAPTEGDPQRRAHDHGSHAG